MAIKTLEQLYQVLMEEMAIAKNTVPEEWSSEDILTSVLLDYLQDAGEVENPIVCSFENQGLQMNAYEFSEDYSELTIFVTCYSEEKTPKTVYKTDVDAHIRRALKMFQKAVNGLYSSLEQNYDAYEFVKIVEEKTPGLEQVKICVLTNGLIKSILLEEKEWMNVHVSFSVWDIERLYRCISSGKQRDPIEINFMEKYGSTIPCVECAPSKKYKVFLAMISGKMLSDLYGEYRERLLEKNVRSYLQARGSVNKGIRDTLRNEPEMFLAYNNGITATAEVAQIVREANGLTSIKKVRDFQIVNGGQTTASIYHASVDKKQPVDLSKVYVQMKLTLIGSADDMDDMVPRISAFSNTQNKVQIADFSANDPFHLRMEELSRSIWAPAQGGLKPVNWFYERARGQYADMVSRETTTARRKQYKEIHPVFTKTDLAKYENTWNQFPYYVSEGAQKNFRRFSQMLSENDGFSPTEQYYKDIIAKAIMFRRAEKLVSDQKFGGYRANIVTYTLAYLSYLTNQKIDLNAIWKNQSLTIALENEITELSKIIQKEIVNPPGGANVGEWCKKEICWESIKNLNYQLSDALSQELVTEEQNKKTIQLRRSFETVTPEDMEMIDKVSAISPAIWFGLSDWAKDNNEFEPWQRSILVSTGITISRNRRPSKTQAKNALDVLSKAKSKGFKMEL